MMMSLCLRGEKKQISIWKKLQHTEYMCTDLLCVLCIFLRSINNIAVCIIRDTNCLYLELSNPIYPEAMIQRQKNLHTQYHPL